MEHSLQYLEELRNMSKFTKVKHALISDQLVYMPDFDMFVIAYSDMITDKTIYVGDLEMKSIYLEIKAEDMEELEFCFYDKDE